MKYMLMMNTPRDGYAKYMSWPKQLIAANTDFMRAFSRKLAEAGELVSAAGLVSPVRAKLVRAGDDGKPVTDGVFPETKEFLAGYWIVQVDSAARVRERSRGIDCTGHGRLTTGDRGSRSLERSPAGILGRALAQHPARTWRRRSTSGLQRLNP